VVVLKMNRGVVLETDSLEIHVGRAADVYRLSLGSPADALLGRIHKQYP